MQIKITILGPYLRGMVLKKLENLQNLRTELRKLRTDISKCTEFFCDFFVRSVQFSGVVLVGVVGSGGFGVAGASCPRKILTLYLQKGKAGRGVNSGAQVPKNKCEIIDATILSSHPRKAMQADSPKGPLRYEFICASRVFMQILLQRHGNSGGSKGFYHFLVCAVRFRPGCFSIHP